VGSTRLWLFLVLGQIATLAILAMAYGQNEAPVALQLLGAVCAAGIFICVPPLMIKLFVAGQLRIGNGHLAMVRGLQQHQATVVFVVWGMMVAVLLMAWPLIRSDIRAEQQANAAAVATSEAEEQAARLHPAAGAATSASASPTTPATATATAALPVSTPGPGSPERTAILDALRNRLRSSGRFRVDHLRVAGGWAFVRATETVVLAGGETQETDNTVAALLELPAGSTTGWWRIANLWTLPTDAARPLAEFTREVRARQRAEGLPAALFPDDF
jgi:hypothetical protein